MQDIARIDDRFAVAKFAPDREAIRRLAEQGFRTVVNHRTDDERQDLPPFEEGGAVNEAGMDYLHYPVSGGALDDFVVDSFREKLPGLPTPVLIHCGSGKRAGAIALMHVASEQGMSGEDALRKAREAGLNLGDLEHFVKDYVERHNGK